MNGNKHLTWTVFTFILGGVIGFSYLIFKMGAANVAAQIEDLKKKDDGIMGQYTEQNEKINEKLDSLILDMVKVKIKLGIPQEIISREK